ncbi:SDR family NAD(P)-dependent oxidoreductase [Neisseria sp. Ec49-e6-T10]|uniref:SDR family NAD(P)-dependent oxidoreductase n=1 Tax=Neisseria sp. Ec49-e6-T10 TaxID=3140744 RepID=UPI003EBE0DAE
MSLLASLLFPKKQVNLEKLKQYLTNKTILITGASFGIGEALAYLLGQTNAHLILVARTKEKLSYIKKHIQHSGNHVSCIAINLADPMQVDDLLRHLQSLPNKIDIFVNNAGKSIRRSFIDSLDRHHDVERSMALNYFAPIKLTQGLFKHLQQTNGHIVHVSAVNVLLAPPPYWSAYQSSKTAFDQWLRCNIPELYAHNIATSIVYFPLVKTRMIEPTQMYQHVPAMNVDQAAIVLAQCLLKRPRTFKPWWLPFIQAFNPLTPLWEKIWCFSLKKKNQKKGK